MDLHSNPTKQPNSMEQAIASQVTLLSGPALGIDTPRRSDLGYASSSLSRVPFELPAACQGLPLTPTPRPDNDEYYHIT